MKCFMIWLALLSYGAGMHMWEVGRAQKINCKNKKGQCMTVAWDFWEFLF